ncbi:MAG: dockerin type I repeat-containing protein [Microgenomates group bacterium]
MKNFKSLPAKTKNLMSLGIIIALVVALPLFVWALTNLNFNQKERAATGEPPINHPAYWNTGDVTISADDFYVIIAGEYYFANDSSVIANTVAIDANTLQTDIVTQEHNRNTSLRIIFKKGNGQWWAESIEGRIDGNQFVTYNGPFINYTVGYPYTLDGERYFEFTDPYNSSEKGIIFVTNLFVNAFTSVTPPPTTPGNSQCSQGCQSNNDCVSGLVCFIPSNQSSGSCKNPQCTSDADCSCAIAKTITCQQPFNDAFNTADQYGTPDSNVWETTSPGNVYVRNDTDELIISIPVNTEASHALRSLDIVKDGENFQTEVDVNTFLTGLTNPNDLATAELKAYNNDSNYFTIRWVRWMDNSGQHSKINLWSTVAGQTTQNQGVDIPSGSTPKLKLVRSNGQKMIGYYDLGSGYIKLGEMSGVYAGPVRPTLFAYKRGVESSYVSFDNFKFGCITPDINRSGDINGDGKVNIVDIGIVVENYGSTDPNLNGADVSGDGKVNIVDIGIIIDNYIY